MFQLVKTVTQDKLTLSGLFSDGDKSKPVILHIHGFEGDFFTNEFVNVITNRLRTQNTAFLSVQTRGIGNEYLMKLTDGSWKKYGAHFEILEDTHNDIDAWIEFLLNQGYTNILLQGHSLGTMKIVRYLFEGKYADKVRKLVLLAPFDIFKLLEDVTKGKWRDYLEIAKQKVNEGKGEEIIPKEFLDVEMSYQTYVSHHSENDFEYMFAFHKKGYTFPLLQKIQIPVKVIVGSKDEWFHPANPSQPAEAIALMKQYIKTFSSKIVDGAGHGYDGYEEIVADEIRTFV